ncbi:hypothetical protein D1007_32518 [Hordeum vulgare]|nr:hypothetical protein D1007_32518 [Hordeum vulgare]
MGDARRARAERRTTRIAQTEPAGPAGVRRSPSPVVNAAMCPDAQEQQGSSQQATEHLDGHTVTPSLVWASGSASHTWPKMPHSRRALSMATELLRYRPATMTGSSASWSSSPLPTTPQCSAVRFNPNRPKQMTRSKMRHPHHRIVTCVQSPDRKSVPVTDLASPGRGQETKQDVRWFLDHDRRARAPGTASPGP